MGIEPQAKPAVKRGTLWYLSQAAGYESPFGDRHPDSLFNPVPIKKAAPAPRPAAPKPKARSSEQVSPVSTPAPVSTPVPLTHLPSSVDPAQALAELEGNLELGRGKRKRKLASDVATTDQPSKVAAVSVSSATTMTSQPPSIHEQSPSSAECNGSSGLRRLKVKLTAPAPAPCPVFSQPIDGDDEEEKITSSDVDMSESDEEHLSSSMICRETLASERRRFRKRSRSEGHMLLSVPLDSDEPRTATLSDHHCSAPDYLGYSTSMSSSAPALDSWALLSRTTPGPFEQEECKADHQDDPQVATRRDPSADLADGEESEVAPDTLFDECEDNTSTAATTPRSPLQVKQEPFDMDESFICKLAWLAVLVDVLD